MRVPGEGASCLGVGLPRSGALLKDIWGEGILEASLHGMHDLITPNP